MITGALIAGCAVLVLSGMIFWANPRRPTNRAVVVCSLNVAAWLLSIHFMVSAEEGLPWLRLTTAIGGLIPFSLWVVKETISNQVFSRKDILAKGKGWISACALLCVIPFTEWFIPEGSTGSNRLYGPAYFGYIIGFILLCLILAQRTFSRVKTITGLAKLELQIWLLGGTLTCLTVILLMVIRSVLGITLNFQVAVVFAFYAFTTFAITTHRIFDARHILMSAAQRVVLLISVTLGAWIVHTVSSSYLPSSTSFILTVVTMLWFAGWVNSKLDVWLLRYPKAVQARLAAFEAAQSEIRTTELRHAFESVLNGWGQTDRSVLMIDEGQELTDEKISIPKDSGIIAALKEADWATPERLDRERETSDRRALKVFLREHQLGILIYEEGPTMTIMVGLGVRPSRKPFTFPEVIQLKELVSIFDSSLSRTQLLAKAQRAEQLATVGMLGAGVAHEIRNPLVSIKAFAQLLPKHHTDPVFRERFSRLIVDEVGRIDRLTEQLLDLAAPHSYEKSAIRLHDLIQSSLELVMARVASRNIHLSTSLEASPDIVFSDANGLKQVLLNLCFNAVQAQETKEVEAPIEVKLSTQTVGPNVELIVSDDGPGIRDDERDHLFEAFHSTKSNGFGLGLTVCSEILSSLDATITLDPFEDGTGAVFRVLLPCPPRSS